MFLYCSMGFMRWDRRRELVLRPPGLSWCVASRILASPSLSVALRLLPARPTLRSVALARLRGGAGAAGVGIIVVVVAGGAREERGPGRYACSEE